MIFDNLTMAAIIWAAFTGVLVMKLTCGGCCIKKLLGKPCTQ